MAGVSDLCPDSFLANAANESGRGGIRTHGEFNPTFDFESSALNQAQPLFLFILRHLQTGV